jgi:hypothetical protein
VVGKRSIPLEEIDEITYMSLLGRYAFLLITPTSYAVVSSLMENFPQLSVRIKENVTEKAYKNMDTITPEMLRRKNNHMKGVMIAAIILCITAAIYTNIM